MIKSIKHAAKIGAASMLAMAALTPSKSFAWADWHEAAIEVVWGDEYEQYSENVDVAGFGGATKEETELVTLTFEYSNGWKYGDTYLYMDVYKDQDEITFYSQGFFAFSLGKIFDVDLSFGPIQDVMFGTGWTFNNIDDFYAGDAAQTPTFGATKDVYEAHDIMDVLYGIKLPLSIPFTEFAGMWIGVWDDFSEETEYDLTTYVDFYWRSVFYLGDTRWKFEGYLDYYGDRDSAVSSSSDLQESWFGQFQLLLDVGLIAYSRPNSLYVGTEIQFTHNTFGIRDDAVIGTAESDELFPAFVVEWTF